jgi:hypothetical protein
MAPHLTLVTDGGRRLEPRPQQSLPIEAGSDPRATAFLLTMELAVRQAGRLLDSSQPQPARLRRLCQVLLNEAREVSALTEEDAQWTIEPFVGA